MPSAASQRDRGGPLPRRDLLVGATGLLVGTTGLVGATGLLVGAALTGCTRETVSHHTRHSYGPGPAQYGDLYLPRGRQHGHGTVVVIHGGFWRAEYSSALGAPLAADLAARGYPAFNLEYRRVGNGGGWLNTLRDVAAGIDLLATLDVDVSRVVAIGHSAGGQLAAWAAARSHFAAGAVAAHPRVPVTAVVSQAGVLDLATAANQRVGGTAASDFLGGTPAAVPTRYAFADPIQQLPLRAPVLCVHSRADQNVPYAQSTAYVAAARAAGATATLTEVAGDHFTLIDPTSSAWTAVVRALPGYLAG